MEPDTEWDAYSAGPETSDEEDDNMCERDIKVIRCPYARLRACMSELLAHLPMTRRTELRWVTNVFLDTVLDLEDRPVEDGKTLSCGN